MVKLVEARAPRWSVPGIIMLSLSRCNKRYVVAPVGWLFALRKNKPKEP
jgi:hypothetical protein